MKKHDRHEFTLSELALYTLIIWCVMAIVLGILLAEAGL